MGEVMDFNAKRHPLPDKLKWALEILARSESPIRTDTKDMKKVLHWAWSLGLADRKWPPGEHKVHYQITEAGRKALENGYVTK